MQDEDHCLLGRRTMQNFTDVSGVHDDDDVDGVNCGHQRAYCSSPGYI
jgi:hypothetical protein